jgi:hypothetical protein
MILAAVNSTLFKLLFLGHMLSFVVAFAPAVINPVLVAKTKGDGDPAALGRLAGHLAGNGRQIHFPALIALGGFGILMVLEGDVGFDHAWVSLAFLVWLAICGIISGVMLPGERKMATGDMAAEKTVERCGQLTTLLLLVMLYLMIWKPGA